MKTLLIALALAILVVPANPLSAQIRVEDHGSGQLLCADGIVDSPTGTVCVEITGLTAQQLDELADIRARAAQLSLEMDPMVAYLARDILTALVLSAPDIDLRSWSITPIGFDRAIINGSLYMAHSGAPGSMRSYTFTITPEAGGG